MNKIAIQGNADGLCGLYCIINFLKQFKLGEDSKAAKMPMVRRHHRESFRYVMRAAESLGFLTADRLYDGFEAPELRLILDRTMELIDEEYHAETLDRLNRQLEIENYDALLTEVLEKGGVAIISVENEGHWILAISRRGKKTLNVIDPSKGTRAISIDQVDHNFDGIAIFPGLAACRISNAQTH